MNYQTKLNWTSILFSVFIAIAVYIFNERNPVEERFLRIVIECLSFLVFCIIFYTLLPERKYTKVNTIAGSKNKETSEEVVDETIAGLLAFLSYVFVTLILVINSLK
jgi:preprotein translocase subunit SecG